MRLSWVTLGVTLPVSEKKEGEEARLKIFENK